MKHVLSGSQKLHATTMIAGACVASLLSLATTAAGDEAVRDDDRPNILFFVTDDQSPMPWAADGYLSAPAFGYCDSPGVHTPEIDRLAANGLQLSRAYVSSSVCSPSRYASLTGRFAGRCRGSSFLRLHPPGTMTRVENNTELESDLPNLANTLRSMAIEPASSVSVTLSIMIRCCIVPHGRKMACKTT